MKRSNLGVHFTDYDFNKFCAKYREYYKKENGKNFTGSVLHAITIGVLAENTLPNTDNTVLLIKLGKGFYGETDSDKRACEILTEWKQRDEYKERGELGIFCDLCRDAHIDLNIAKINFEIVDSMEQAVINQLEAQKQRMELASNIKNLTNQLSEAVKNIKAEIETVEGTTENEVAETVE